MKRVSVCSHDPFSRQHSTRLLLQCSERDQTGIQLLKEEAGDGCPGPPGPSLTFFWPFFTSLLGPGYALCPGHLLSPHPHSNSLLLTQARRYFPAIALPTEVPAGCGLLSQDPRTFSFYFALTFRRLPAPPQPRAWWRPCLHWQQCGSQGPDGQDALGVTGLVISEADPTSNVGV